MASAREEQLELLAYLDGIMACIENYPMFNIQAPFLDVGVGVNVMALLLQLLAKFYTEEEIVDFLVKILVYELPAIELAIKAVILSNLKLSISCNVDPWIPDEWRQHMVNPSQDTKSAEDDPCAVAISTIDHRNMLRINPLSNLGQKYYNTTCVQYKYLNPYIETSTSPIKSNIQGTIDTSTLPKMEAKYINSSDYSQVFQLAKNKFGERFDKKKIVSIGDLESIYELSHAIDMNAFIWFVLNKGIYVDINRTDISRKDLPENALTIATKPLFHNNIEGNINDPEDNKKEFYLSGDLISTYESPTNTSGKKVNSTNYCICTKGEKVISEENNNGNDLPYVYNAEIYPCSNRADSFIWYAPKIDWYNTKTRETKPQGFVYDTSLPLCNFSYVDSKGAPSLYTMNSNGFLKVKILPKPMLHYCKSYWLLSKEKEGITIPSPFIRIRFDAEGNQDSKGRFSVMPRMKDGKIIKPTFTSKNIWGAEYQLLKVNGDDSDFYLQVINNKTYNIVQITHEIDNDNNKKKTTTPLKDLDENIRKKFINECLFPCYPGLTVYEFNYDFVMRTKLLDVRQTARRILDSLMSFQIGLDLGFSMEETIYQMRVSEIITQLIESDAYEISDCFFSFSNDKYASMLHEAEVKRSQGYPFADDASNNPRLNTADILSVLDELQPNATKQEQTDVLKRTFTQATANITQEVLPHDRLNISKNFIIDALKVLGVAIFDALLSPKMLLLFEINQRIMDTGEDKSHYPTFEELIKQFKSLIIAILSELMQKIIEEILGMVIPKIEELVQKLASMISLEQITIYKELIMRLIKACSFSFPLFGKRANLDTELDVVQYADIDPIDEPKTDNC